MKLIVVSPFFVHSEDKNEHTYMLAFTATALLNYLKFVNKNRILSF